jgi:hypothetical protein
MASDQRVWLTDWRRHRLAIFGYLCGVFALLAAADFLGLLGQ